METLEGMVEKALKRNNALPQERIITAHLFVQDEDGNINSEFPQEYCCESCPDDWDDDLVAEELETLTQLVARMMEAS